MQDKSADSLSISKLAMASVDGENHLHKRVIFELVALVMYLKLLSAFVG